jgi:lipopolysaccharide transport system ATP-binding protein
MTGPAIRAVGLSKQYRLQQKERYSAVRDVVANAYRRLWRGAAGAADEGETLWALRDVSFEVGVGDVVGIVGHNGAGKSTLLKLLSRITRPTAGFAEVRGRIGSLLEVGTGFHMDLSGRDNVYLSGAILGMRKQEIDRKFDEIVAFSEVERFIDMPVKHYSNGMYVRIAFAVAAHLQPEILIVDEVLAVGDPAFQQKCIGKMNSVAQEGRTVLFVSHNIGAVNALCRSAMRLDHGRLVAFGDTAEVTDAFLADQLGSDATGAYRVDERVLERQDRSAVEIVGIEIANPARPDGWPATGDPLKVRIAYRAAEAVASPWFCARIDDPHGTHLLYLHSGAGRAGIGAALHRHGCAELHIDTLSLVGGRYRLSVTCGRQRHAAVHLERVAEFHVRPQDVYGSGVPMEQPHGLMVAGHRWTHRAQP